MAVVDDGGWLPDKEPPPITDIESSTKRFERWRGHRQLLILLLLFAALVILIAVITAVFIYYYYVPHQIKPKIPQKTCEKMYCMYGALCKVNHGTQQASCRCQESCNQLFAPVCGTDGITYASECHLRMASCKQQRRIIVHHQGQCDVKDPCEEKVCPFGSRCRPALDGQSAECICPDKCATYGDSRGSRPICGTDGHNYPNYCELQKTSCKEMRDIHVKFQGRCDPCEGVDCPSSQICQLDDNRNPVCRCNAVCPTDVRPVCGSDGKTYTNECTLRVESCRSRKSLRILYTGECSAGANPCERLNCGLGEECEIDRYGIATCQCPDSCEAVMRPVCGSDGRNYYNECDLMRQNCLYKKGISLSYRGECGERGPCFNHRCTFGSVCVIKLGHPVCECASCTQEFEPVCGTNGISYTNLCHMKRESCEQQSYIDIGYEGLCNGCEGKRCEFYAVCESDDKKDARCVCPHSCVKVESTVCGTDGVTYLNECEMRVAACSKQQYVVVGTRGPCDLCENIHCKYGAHCENGQCVCPTDCPADLYEAVCATDGATHFNECDMRRSACVQKRNITILFYGECEDVNSSGQETNSAIVGCQEKVCNYGSSCDYDTEGLPVCICSFDCPLDQIPVCGSDGVVYDNDCRLKEESCRKQQQLYILPMAMCDDYKHVPCDGEMPLRDPLTGDDYFCGVGEGAKQCPPSSYCHKTPSFSKCCREIVLIKTCADSSYGCCPDDKTPSLGPNFAGCPSVCNCNRLGSYGLTCDADTQQCSCKPGVGGQRCDRCEPGYWGLHRATEGSTGCTSCNCNVYGSVRDDCEQMTGRCVCKQGIKGMKCDTCPHGAVLGPNGCTDVSISLPVPGTCAEMVCLHSAICKEKHEIEMKVQCVCDFQCSSARDYNQSVCGSDGNTYGSECQMKLFSCRYQKPISVFNEGPCKRRTQFGVEDNSAGTPGPSRRSTAQKTLAAETKFTRNIIFTHPESYKLTASPTISASTTSDDTAEIPSFFGRSYLELPRLEAYSRLSLELEFRTFSKNGILLYNGQTKSGIGDFVSLTLKDSYVEFRYDLGNGPVVLRSLQKLHLGRYHRLVAKRYLRDGLLTLDGQTFSGRSFGSLKSLDLSENLYLGYVPTQTDRIFKSINANQGMIGCIRKLKIGDKDIDLRIYTSKDIIQKAHIRECRNGFCYDFPCQNNGICEEERNVYTCLCPPGYTGKLCESMENPCLHNPCPEWSTCERLQGNSFTCRCLSEEGDHFCSNDLKNVEELFVAEFDGNSYLEFPTLPHIRHSFNIEIWFLSRTSNGILLYNGQKIDGSGDFVAITLSDRYVYFHFDLGRSDSLNSGLVNIKSSEPFALNEWHTVKVSRLKRNGTLQLDNGPINASQSLSSLTELNLELNLYIGGLPDSTRINPEISNRAGLNGAIQRIIVNGDIWTNMLTSATWSHQVKSYRGPPCGGPTSHGNVNQCLNGGLCIPWLNEAICRCSANYTGSKCEKEEHVHDVKKSIAFDGRTHYNFSQQRASKATENKDFNIELTFRTSSENSLLLWISPASAQNLQSEYHFALSIVNGNLHVSFHSKEQIKPLQMLKSDQSVNDLLWHCARIEKNIHGYSLSVDNVQSSEFTSSAFYGIEIINYFYWIGGNPNIPKGLHDYFYRGFVGCIKRILADSDLIDPIIHNDSGVTLCGIS